MERDEPYIFKTLSMGSAPTNLWWWIFAYFFTFFSRNVYLFQKCCCLFFQLLAGADVNDRTLRGETALHLAATNDNANISTALIENGLDVDALDENYNNGEFWSFFKIPEKMLIGRSPCGVVVNILNFGLKVSEFKFQLGYYIHFRTNTFRKGIEPLYPHSYELNSTTTVPQGWLWL